MTSAKSGTLLPEFPLPSQLILPAHVEISKVNDNLVNRNFLIENQFFYSKLLSTLSDFSEVCLVKFGRKD